MKRFAPLFLLLLFAPPCAGQDQPKPDAKTFGVKKGDTPPSFSVVGDTTVLVKSFGQPLVVSGPPGMDIYNWSVPAALKSQKTGNTLTVTGADVNGDYKVELTCFKIEWKAEKVTQYDLATTFTINCCPPTPPVPPGPGPTPTTPKLVYVVVITSAGFNDAPYKADAALNARISQYGGSLNFVPATSIDPAWATYVADAKLQPLPCVFVVDGTATNLGTALFKGPLGTPADLLKTIQQVGG